jgi:hypothetical protein
MLPAIRFIAFAISICLLYKLPFRDNQGFSFYNSDIIILLLGNMAFFGSIIWWLTKKQALLRLALLPFIMAVFLGSKEAGSWNEVLYNWSPLPWLYKFYYLKYLFIILPGTLAGEWLLENKQISVDRSNSGINSLRFVAFLSFLLVVINVLLLFSRHTVINLLITSIICGSIFYIIKKSGYNKFTFLQRFLAAGTYLLILGLFFESYEGGIKKDPSTYSYYFITGGLAFFMLIGFYGFHRTKAGKVVVNYLSLNGQNPMVAYVTGNLLLIPLLSISGGMGAFTAMETNVWLGVLRGILFTGVVSLITIFFTKRGWLWKT